MTATRNDAEYFERLYQTMDDPWDYRQAAEQGKYRLTLQAARRWQPHPTRVLEVGCSLGYLTELLAGYATEVTAVDISETAVRRTRERCAALTTSTHFDIRIGDVLAPGFVSGLFDVVFLGDVLEGNFEGSQRAVEAVQAVLPLLTPNGVLIAADHLRPSQQVNYQRLVEGAGGHVVEKVYFNDRYWFRLKGALKGLRTTAFGQRLLRSERVYQFLARRSEKWGPEGSKHFGLVVRARS